MKSMKEISTKAIVSLVKKNLAVAARHMGMRIVGISCISNLACGISAVPLSHEEVQETADAVAPKFKALVTETIKNIGKEV